ncbi:hypothetical protein THF1D04_220038 [Vibrio owensii]|uniref:Uncharacterized protein n=1 Tax=Vibrio owensii TaxID=696485 RepID=A0AAU9Q7A3_9VIBR|nr:hypothetical protein THF1D04_220038 [Vibrio owensii]
MSTVYAKYLTDSLGKASKCLVFLSKLSHHSIRLNKQQTIQTIANESNEAEVHKTKKTVAREWRRFSWLSFAR